MHSPQLAPKAIITLSPDPISMDIVQLVRLQRMHYYLWGWVRYNDIFENTPMRLTEFCYEVQATQGLSTEPHAKALNIRYHNCPTHNCYDEDCPDYVTQSKRK